MDKTTSWLVRIASVFVIAAGATGIPIMLDSVGLIDIFKEESILGKDTRVLYRKDGSLSLFNPLTVVAVENEGEYGRYINYRYFLIHTSARPKQWTVDADCQDFKADWDGDTGKETGWRDINTSKEDSSIEAKNILDEFCPQMDRLVKEAQSGTKEIYRYPILAIKSIIGGNSKNNQFGNDLKKENKYSSPSTKNIIDMHMNQFKWNRQLGIQ